jgi:hypothetical protein
MAKGIDPEVKKDVDEIFYGRGVMDTENIDSIVQKFLDNEQIPSPDYRSQVAMYNFADLVKYRVYDTYYLEDNPVKHSLKTFGADAIIQLMIFMKSLGLDIRECIDLGIERMREQTYKSKRKSKKK